MGSGARTQVARCVQQAFQPTVLPHPPVPELAGVYRVPSSVLAAASHSLLILTPISKGPSGYHGQLERDLGRISAETCSKSRLKCTWQMKSVGLRKCQQDVGGGREEWRRERKQAIQVGNGDLLGHDGKEGGICVEIS